MSENLTKKMVEDTNAKPAFFIATATKDSVSDQAIYQQGRSTYNEENGTASMGLNIPICYATEYIEDPKQLLDLLLKGDMFDDLLAAAKTFAQNGWDGLPTCTYNDFQNLVDVIKRAERVGK